MNDVLLRRRPLTPDRSDSSDDDNMDDDFYMSDNEEPFEQRSAETKSAIKATEVRKTPHMRPKTLAVVKKRVVNDDDAFEDGSPDATICSFLDMSFWRREKICCGVIFKGPNNEVVISPKLLKPCSCRIKTPSSSTSGLSPSHQTPIGSSSDNVSLASSFSPISSRLDNEDNESNASSYNSSVP
jgi:hypothetical protein